MVIVPALPLAAGERAMSSPLVRSEALAVAVLLPVAPKLGWGKSENSMVAAGWPLTLALSLPRSRMSPGGVMVVAVGRLEAMVAKSPTTTWFATVVLTLGAMIEVELVRFEALFVAARLTAVVVLHSFPLPVRTVLRAPRASCSPSPVTRASASTWPVTPSPPWRAAATVEQPPLLNRPPPASVWRPGFAPFVTPGTDDGPVPGTMVHAAERRSGRLRRRSVGSSIETYRRCCQRLRTRTTSPPPPPETRTHHDTAGRTIASLSATAQG